MICSQILPIVRTLLGHPTTDKVRTSDIILMIAQAVRGLQSKMKNTDQRWFPTQFEINPPVNQTTFGVPNLAAGGKVLSVEWINPRNPNTSGIEIKVVNWQDLDMTYTDDPVYDVTQGTVGSNLEPYDIIWAIAFQGFGATMEARVTPIPKQSHKYRVYCDQQLNQVAAQGDIIQLPEQYWDLVAVMAAELLLPSCGYPEAQDASFRRTINSNKKDASENFDRWILQNKKQSTHMIKPYRVRGSRDWRNW